MKIQYYFMYVDIVTHVAYSCINYKVFDMPVDNTMNDKTDHMSAT